jgi:sortase A
LVQAVAVLVVAIVVGAGVIFYLIERRSHVHPAQPAAPRLPPIVAENPPPPVAPRLRPGQLIGRLEIPRLRVSVRVVEGADDGELKEAAGHVTGTALPGSDGNVAIAAHRDKYFRPLRNIRDHDLIEIQTPSGAYRYVVRGTEIVKPTDVGVIAPTSDQELTLVTCYPFYYVGHAPRRFIVHATRQS